MAFSALRICSLILVFITLVSGASVLDKRAVDPVPPSQDPFYQPPAGFESKAPGTILAYRQIPIPTIFLLLSVQVTKAVYQIQFRSNDTHGNPIAAITTLFVPIAGDANKVFTQSIAYDASDVDCSPSYQLRQLDNPTPELAVIVIGLYNGWYVQSPDYESYAAAFADGIVSGQVMLDSFRAVSHSDSFSGVNSTARMAMNGGSGGALALEWALELQHTYAPEVNLVGASLGSLTPNVFNVYNTINGGYYAGLAPIALTGIAKTNPDFSQYLQSHLVPATAATFNNASKQCLNQNQAAFQYQNISLYFTNPNFLQAPIPKSTIQKIGVMGQHGTPKVPLYVYKGVQDEVSPVLDTDTLIKKYCAAGAPSIVYVRNLVTNHQGESIIGIVGALGYIQERLDGVPPVNGCVYLNSTQSTLTNADETALGSIGPLVINILNSSLSSVPST